MRRDLLLNVGLPPMWLPWAFRCDDIWVSLEIGRGQPVHWASKDLHDRLVELPEGGAEMALSLQEGHEEQRNAACKWWLEHRV